jgi:hypothetical protein
MNLIDYLPYYLGCDYWTNNSQGNLNAKTLPDVIDMVKRGMDVRLHLRRTTDLTEEEAAHLALIYSGAKKVIKTQGVASNWHYFFCHFNDNEDCEQLVIGSDGCAWYRHYFDEKEPGCRNIVNEHQAVHYLLRQHFDLFNLIDNGLALDAKTITQ